MKRCWMALLAFSAPLLAAPPDGGQLYNRDCSGCHGRQADKPAFNQAPPLASLSHEQIVQGLTDRRDGKINGAGNRAKARLSDENIKALADYIDTLKKK